MSYYVYTIIDPTNDNKPFYVGKGTNKRYESHFKEAMSSKKTLDENNYENCYIDDISQNELVELKNADSENSKKNKINQLLNSNYEMNDIVRFIAKDLDEPVAFAIEALLIKTIYGKENLTNSLEGQHSERFRPCNNWERIEGFDTPSEKKNHSRAGEEEEKFAKGLDEPLMEIKMDIKKDFPHITFLDENPKLKDANDLSIQAIFDIGQVKEAVIIKVFTTVKKDEIQLELRASKKYQKEWMLQHFSKLGVNRQLIRPENNTYELSNVSKTNPYVFLPKSWHHPNKSHTVQEAIKRFKILMEIIHAQDRNTLSPEAQLVLGYIKE